MPVFEEVEDLPAKETPNLIISPTPYETQVVDTKIMSYDTLSTFYAGSKWACDYYSQVQGRDSAAASYNDDLPQAYGQYKLVKGFELILTTPLTHSQNTGDVQGFNSTGSALVYSLITPQSGDVFVADLFGRNVLIQVHNPQRSTVYEESPTTIDFKITDWVDKEFQDKLNSRVVETLYFDRENFRSGVKGLLHQKDVDVMRRLGNAWRRLTALYFRDFFDDNFFTFIMPGQPSVSYDPNVTRFMRRLIGVGDHRLAVQVTELGVSGDVFSNQLSILDAIQQRDIELMYSVCQHWGLTPVSSYAARPLMSSIYYSGIDKVMSPIDTKYTVVSVGYAQHGVDDIVDAGLSSSEINDVLPNLKLNESEPALAARYIKPVLCDNYYVFSKEFYDDEPGKSILESLTLSRLRNDPIDLNLLADIADYAPKFPNLERYYYIPIILTLIKLAPGVL